MMKRITVFLYGVTCYVVFFATFLYAIGWVGDLIVPKSIDSGVTGSLGMALLVNTGLLGLFAVQHSVMARPWFKRAWTRIVPEAAERSTYVLFTSLALIAMFMFWEPMGGVVWEVENTAGRAVMYTMYTGGWLLLLSATFMINHFDLFGLRQVYLYLRGEKYTYLQFRTPGLYNHVRHPIYLAWMIIFWSTPKMTAAHLVFAVATTVYMLMAIRWEENDLVTAFGAKYREYRKNVPMLLPLGRTMTAPAAVETPTRQGA